LEAEGVDVDEWNQSSKGKKMPEKTAIEKLARCWKGYEPVPGKAPYSDDSCRPKGSKAKKKDEKQASLIPDFNSVRGLAKLAATSVAYSLGMPAASSAIGAGMGYLGHKLSDAIHPYEDEDDRRQARNTSMLMGAGGGLGRGMLHVAMRNANQASMDPGASTSKERQAAFEFKMSQRAKENAAKVNAVMERIKATGK
jgi:hypothetical protein